MKKIEIFKEISIGGFSKENLLQKLVHAGIKFNKYADNLFEHPQFDPTKNTEFVKMIIVKLSDLGLDNPCSFIELKNRALAQGLRACPLYLAAFLRLEYLEQAPGPYLTVVSDKPESDENYPNGFYIRNTEGSLWLRGYKADDFCEWPAGNEFIFLK